MMEERRADEREAVEAAGAMRSSSCRRRPGARSRAAPHRSASPPSCSAGGGEIRLLADVPPTEAPAPDDRSPGRVAGDDGRHRRSGHRRVRAHPRADRRILTVLWLVVFGGAIADALTLIGEAIDRATGG